MRNWKTKLTLQIPNKNSTIDAGLISIQRGILQGDALSALWFCLSLNPLSEQLKVNDLGYHLNAEQYNCSHLFYMDDLKLYAETRKNLDRLLNTTETFSNDIGMSFGLDKCKINGMKRGKWTEQEGYALNTNTSEHIEVMNINEKYKYLGIQQTTITKHKEVKELIKEKIKTRIQSLLKTKLSGINMTKAINIYALSVATYTFGVIKWTKTDLQDLNRMIRTTNTRYKTHHPKSSMERFHLPRREGGRGFSDLETLHFKQIKKLREFFLEKSKQSQLHQAISMSDKSFTPLNLSQDSISYAEPPNIQEKIQNWISKPLHGKYPNLINQNHIDRNASLAWLNYGNIFPETEGFMTAIQDKVIATRRYLKSIIKDPSITDDRCRVCRSMSETIEHIISGCSPLANNEYTRRHDNVAKIIYIHLLTQIAPNEPSCATPYYSFTPQPTHTTNSHIIYWNRSVITDRTIHHNKPDIILVNLAEKTTYLIEISVPLAENIDKKQKEKHQKYIPLQQEIKEIWKQEKVIVVPIIVGATGEIPTSLTKSLEQIKIQTNAFIQIQKSVVLDTCAIVRKFLSSTINITI